MKMLDVDEMAERMNVKVMRVGSKIMIDDWHVKMFKKDGEKMSDKREILKRAIDTFGYPSQMHMVIEEMSELTKEICKVFRGDGEVDHLAEEIADVYITVEQLCIMFDLHNLVEEYESHKLERLEKRLDEWGKGNAAD